MNTAPGPRHSPRSSLLACVPAPVLALVLSFMPGVAESKPEADSKCQCLGEQVDAVLWMQHSAEYDASARQAYLLATSRLDLALADPHWSADLAQMETHDYAEKPAAVILDLDETVLDNSPFQGFMARRAAACKPFPGNYDDDEWKEWVRLQRATAVPGAVEFLKHARNRDVQVFFVTNRTEDLEPATIANLAGIGIFTDARHVLSKADTSEKQARRTEIAGTHRIILLVGDDLGDFMPGLGKTASDRMAAERSELALIGTRWIFIPNPSYGGWLRSLPPEHVPSLKAFKD